MRILSNTLFAMIILLFIMIFKLPISHACTVQKVREVHSRLSYSGISASWLPMHEQDLSTRQLCLLEALFLRNLEDDEIFYDLSIPRVFDDITSFPVDDLQFRIIQSVIEKASLSNDIHETRLISNIVHGYRRSHFPNSYRTINQRTFSFSPEKADFIDFVLKRATDDNHYRESDIIYQVLEAENINEQDIRNVKLALLTAGRDFADENPNDSFTGGSLAKYSGFGRSSVVRAMIDPRASRQKKDLMALAVALEHSENAIEEGPLLRRIARTRFESFSQEEYQCTVNALHAYLAPGLKGKSQFVTNNLGYILSNDERCLRDSYFNRDYFTHYEIGTTLDEALSTLENGEEINMPYQCVGHPCP